MTISNVKNFAVGTVSTGYDASATAIVLATGDGAKMPTVPYYATWWDATLYASPDLDPTAEIIYVTACTTDTLGTIARGQDGTTAATHNAGGHVYKLMAAVTAGMHRSKSVCLASGGPTADVTTGISDWGTQFTVPANFLAAGDLLRFHFVFHHKSGSYTSAPRIGFQFAGFDLLPQSAAYWSSTEFTLPAHATLGIRDLGTSGNCFRETVTHRENGTMAGTAMDGRMTFNTTVAQPVIANYRFDAAGETLNLGFWSVELIRP